MATWVTRLLVNKLRRSETKFSKLLWQNGKAIGGGAVLLVASCSAISSSSSQVSSSRWDTLQANISGFVRFIRSVNIGLQITLDYWISMRGLTDGHPNTSIMMARIHTRCANRILDGCLQNGGTYIKMGQGLVSLSHILPVEYIRILTALQDKCQTSRSEDIRRIFLEDLGRQPEDMFRCFETSPIAAASLAQVYRARTLEGDLVAVKVQYIDLQSRFHSDVKTIKFLLSIAARLHPHFNFSWILDNLVDTLKQELDFVHEAKNAEKCAEDLKHIPFAYVPKVYWEYTSTRVLVTEFVDAIKINDKESLQSNGFSLRDIDAKLLEIFGHQIFHTGFVHADPHPGNVLVRKNGKTTELVLLDHGLYQSISDDERLSLGQLWRAVVWGKHDQMKKFSSTLGVEDYETFAEVLTQFPLKKRKFKLSAHMTPDDLKEMAEMARHRFDLVVMCLRQMPSNLLLVIRNLNTMRAILYDHGNPVDRFTILSHIATREFFRQGAWHQKLLKYPQWMYFEFKLLMMKYKQWIWRTTLNFYAYIAGFNSSEEMRLALFNLPR